MNKLSNPQDQAPAAVHHDKKVWLEKAQIACKRIPPLWPLQNFVAVNPYLGFSNLHFLQANVLLEQAAHQAALMPVSHYQSKIQAGKIQDAHLEEALRLIRLQYPEGCSEEVKALTVTHLKIWLNVHSSQRQPLAAVESVAEMVDRINRSSWADAITQEVSKHCAAYYDEGQSAWRLPWSAQPLYAAWLERSAMDANLELMGWKGLRNWIALLPASPEVALVGLLEKLGLQPKEGERYLHRLLISIAGWSGHVQFKVRQNGLAGIPDNSLLQLLAIRLAYDVAALECLGSVTLRDQWNKQWKVRQQEAHQTELVMHYACHLASELAYQGQLVSALRQPHAVEGEKRRAKAQAVFCIDVRSEVFRRALETTSAEIETRGFAGFFGMPLELIPFGQQHGQAQCPVLLNPQFKVRETLAHGNAKAQAKALATQRAFKQFHFAWNAFKSSAISCFSFVETLGVGFAWRLFRNAFLSHLRADGAPPPPNRKPDIHQHEEGHHPHHHHDAVGCTGIAKADQVRLARGALKHMGLRGDFARLVLLCGHGSESTNNAFAASLECGACGGHSGEANARVAAEILNLDHVRLALAKEGVVIPQDTFFIAGLHNTTTDEVTLFDLDQIPASHAEDLAALQVCTQRAGEIARRERARALGIKSRLQPFMDCAVHSRAADWSQVRPEWGLVNNASFIIGPRQLTRQLNLGGRSFLHDYDYSHDGQLETLELILTAPVVVTSWINLQYYGSTVQHSLFGSGNKVLHNVVGTLGVCVGNGGDLRAGLPLQSVHDGKSWVHDPLRLSVFLAAPREAINQVLENHPEVQQLFSNGWIHLVAMDPQGQTFHRYLKDNEWMPVAV
jgi:uncharacterized protein YbcC (UPF0753/DUF2309 family)